MTCKDFSTIASPNWSSETFLFLNSWYFSIKGDNIGTLFFTLDCKFSIDSSFKSSKEFAFLFFSTSDFIFALCSTVVNPLFCKVSIVALSAFWIFSVFSIDIGSLEVSLYSVLWEGKIEIIKNVTKLTKMYIFTGLTELFLLPLKYSLVNTPGFKNSFLIVCQKLPS